MSSNLLKYEDYFGIVEYSAADRCFHGKIEFINDLVTFEATTVEGIETEFVNAVRDYIETCRNIGKEPQKTFKGSFNVRIPPELHKQASLIASKQKIALNKFVENAIQHEVFGSTG
jgi:predicted HicB family RNase H-like nuclease